MKKFLKGFIALSLGLAMVGCAKEYDDTALKSKVDELSKEVSRLSQDVKALNSQVVGFKEVIDQWKAGGYVESVQPVKEGDKEVGQTITFLGGKTVTIYYGKDGKDGDKGDKGDKGDQGDPGTPGTNGTNGTDGKTPEITIGTIAGAEGLYWLVDGQALKVDGKPVPATVLPVFSINAEGHLIVTINGEDQDLGLVKGAGGDSMFKSVEVTENGVIFTPATGDPFTIPFAKKFKLVIEQPEQEVAAGKTVKIPYTVQNANESTTIDVFANGNYLAKVVEGNIEVTAPDPFVNGQVLVWAQNDEGLFSMVKLSFTEDVELKIVTKEEEYQAIPAEAGDFEVNVTCNVDVDVKIPEAATWVTAVVTKTAYKVTFTLAANETGAPREAEIAIVRKDNGQELQTIKIVQLKVMKLAIKTLFAKNSTASEAWNAYYGGTAGTDRNIAMDDDYIYIAESTAAAKLWAISVADPNQVKQVNVEGVTGGGAHVLSCPRVVKNTDASVNGGKDVLICSSLTRGGVDPKLYVWANGIDSAPTPITLTTWATDNWYGDTFTVWGTLQDGVLLFDKTDTGGNGVVTFILNGIPANKNLILYGRVKTVDAFGSHTGVCALYPFPDGSAGVYSPGRGTEARGQIATFGNSLKTEGGISVTFSPLDYDEGTNGFVLGYNFVEWKGNRYVIYGNYVSNKKGYVRVRQGALTDEWSKVASTGTRLYRRDLVSGGMEAGNSAMDITARVINGELYIAAQMQNVGFGLYKLCYE